MKRADATKAAEAAGAKVGSSVTKNTNILIAGAGAGAKKDEAKAKGVEIWTEDQFLATIGGGAGTAAAPKGGKQKAASAQEEGDEDDEDDECPPPEPPCQRHWDDLSDEQRAHARTLEYDPRSWECNMGRTLTWAELMERAEEREAALALGFTEATWVLRPSTSRKLAKLEAMASADLASRYLQVSDLGRRGLEQSVEHGLEQSFAACALDWKLWNAVMAGDLVAAQAAFDAGAAADLVRFVYRNRERSFGGEWETLMNLAWVNIPEYAQLLRDTGDGCDEDEAGAALFRYGDVENAIDKGTAYNIFIEMHPGSVFGIHYDGEADSKRVCTLLLAATQTPSVRPSVIDWLIDHGANPDHGMPHVSDNDNFDCPVVSPLLKVESAEAARALLHRGADANFLYGGIEQRGGTYVHRLKGYHPLLYVRPVGGGRHVLDVLMRFADVNYAVYVYDEVGVVRCYWAQVVASGDLDRARACLEFGGADPNWPHIKPQGMGTLTSVPFRPYTTVLLIAICRADLPMVTCLLEHGADPNLPGLDHGLVGCGSDVGPGSLDLADPLNKRYQLWDSASKTYDTSAIDPAKAATPLSVARHIGHEGIITLLEARGAVSDPMNMSLPLNSPRDEEGEREYEWIEEWMGDWSPGELGKREAEKAAAARARWPVTSEVNMGPGGSGWGPGAFL